MYVCYLQFESFIVNKNRLDILIIGPYSSQPNPQIFVARYSRSTDLKDSNEMETEIMEMA